MVLRSGHRATREGPLFLVGDRQNAITQYAPFAYLVDIEQVDYSAISLYTDIL